jgi:hypothetical protein
LIQTKNVSFNAEQSEWRGCATEGCLYENCLVQTRNILGIGEVISVCYTKDSHLNRKLDIVRNM